MTNGQKINGTKRVLVACEYSGIVRSAFDSRGWDAWSADLLNTEIPGNHFVGDVLEILNLNWDLLIGFPPCTFLTYAGMANWYDNGRAMSRIKAAEFFMKLWEAPVKHICLENPRGIMNKIFRESDMVIHPYFFGEREMKRTCLWLKNLPLLQYQLSDNLFEQKTASEKPEPSFTGIHKKSGRLKKRYYTDTLVNGKYKSSKDKSKSFSSIASAMAEQWTLYFNLLTDHRKDAACRVSTQINNN